MRTANRPAGKISPKRIERIAEIQNVPEDNRPDEESPTSEKSNLNNLQAQINAQIPEKPLQVRTKDSFDDKYGEDGRSYLIYFANEINKKLKEIRKKITLTLPKESEEQRKACKAFKLFFPYYPSSFELGKQWRNNKSCEEILSAANKARRAAEAANTA